MNRTSCRVWWLVLLSLIENYRSEARIFDLTKQKVDLSKRISPLFGLSDLIKFERLYFLFFYYFGPSIIPWNLQNRNDNSLLFPKTY